MRCVNITDCHREEYTDDFSAALRIWQELHVDSELYVVDFDHDRDPLLDAAGWKIMTAWLRSWGVGSQFVDGRTVFSWAP